MTLDCRGRWVLSENTLPVHYAGDHMPLAVVAADLAVSPIRRNGRGDASLSTTSWTSGCGVLLPLRRAGEARAEKSTDSVRISTVAAHSPWEPARRRAPSPPATTSRPPVQYSNKTSEVVQVGKNVRYSHHYDKLIENRLFVEISKRGSLQSLSERELELERSPVTIDPRPSPARAWVRFGPHPVLVDVLVDRWTDRAVGVKFMVGDVEMRAWVYTGAVHPAPEKPRQDESGRP